MLEKYTKRWEMPRSHAIIYTGFRRFWYDIFWRLISLRLYNMIRYVKWYSMTQYDRLYNTNIFLENFYIYNSFLRKKEILKMFLNSSYTNQYFPGVNVKHIILKDYSLR